VRRKEEFYCAVSGGGCGKYFKTYLRSNMSGNYTIECPNCGHHHFRVIDKGLVTDDRNYSRRNDQEILVGLKSTLSDTPWHDDPAFRRQQLFLARSVGC
jgi:DNA-directed RNA polymerase subunit RPC12/RpoP